MLVSVCMATYNGAEFIKEQVDSILNQVFKENPDTEIELVVSDDGSKDTTINILENYNDKRIRIFLHHDQRQYRYLNASRKCMKNFENAMQHANGDYIFLSDQDDVWYPYKVDKAVSLLKNGGGTVASAFDMGDGRLRKNGMVVYPHDYSFFSFRQFGIYGFSIAFTKDEMKYFLPFPTSCTGHDVYIQYSSHWRKTLRFIDEPCAIHRYSGIHNVSSFGKNNVMVPLYLKVLFRLNTYISVMWRALVR